MSDLVTLQTRLSQAEEALHRLHMGEREVKIATTGAASGKSVEFAQTEAAKLERYIATLRGEIDRLSGRARGPILLSF